MESRIKTITYTRIEIERTDMEFLMPPHYVSRKSTLGRLFPKKEKLLPNFFLDKSLV